jgi:hypothetical protein
MNILDFKRKLLPLSGYMGDSGGGGGGSSQPSTQTQTTELPEWARPYAKDVLAKGAALSDVNQNPYQQYGANRIAGFSPLQEMSFQGAANMQPSQQLGMGSDLAAAAGIGALGTNYQAGRFGGGMFGQGAADFYMNPYQQNVTDIGKREAARQSSILGAQQAGQATQAGAFGGSRFGIQQAERERNLGQQMQDIQAQGSNAAYTNAQQQFNADQARRLQAQQLGEQSRQYGAGLGMQGLQTALQGAGQLGALGGQQFQQGMDINKLQSAYGGQMQQQAQRPLDQAYQDFLNQQNYPYKQLGFMSDLVRGLPLGQKSTSSLYEAPGSVLGQLGGLGMGAYGVSQLMKAEGGSVHDYAEGGDVTSSQNVEGILSKLSDQQLAQAKQAALARRDVEQANMIDAELAQRASIRGGLGGAFNQIPEQQQEEMMADGGIVAFADRGEVKEMPEKSSSVLGDIWESIGGKDAVNALREGYYKSREEEKRRNAAEDMLPGIAESMTPTERTRRKSVGSEMFNEPKSVKSMSPAEIEAANASIVGAPKPSAAPSGTSTAGAGRGSYQGYVPSLDIKGSSKAAKAPSISDLAQGPKPSKAEVKSAVQKLAEQNNLSSDEKEDQMALALKIAEGFGKQNQPIIDKLNAAIEAQKPDEQALKDRGIGQALAQFGFGMAERASKPGARFLESASGASPILAAVADKTNNLIDTRKENYTKLKLDQAKYEVALAKGDMQTATALAGQIRQSQQQDKLLAFHIADAQDKMALEKQKLAQQAANQGQLMSRYETVGSLTRDIMQNEGLPYDKAFEKASNALKGGIPAGIRSEASLASARAKAIEKVQASLPGILLATTPESSPKYAERKKRYDQAVQAEMDVLFPGGMPSGGNAPSSNAQRIRLNQNGEIIQ